MVTSPGTKSSYPRPPQSLDPSNRVCARVCAPERTVSRAKTSRVHTICAQYCRHDCCIHRWTHRLPSMPSSPLAPKHTTKRIIPSRPWSLLWHSAPTAVGYCCFYCYNAWGWDRLAQIIVTQGETRKRGGIHTRVLAGRGQAVEMGCRQAAPFRHKQLRHQQSRFWLCSLAPPCLLDRCCPE